MQTLNQFLWLGVWMIQNKALKRRIVEVSYKLKLGHIGSCLTAVDIIKEIYDTKRADERFILSAGHAGLAWYTVIEAFGGKSAEAIFRDHGVHPDRCSDCGLSCSSGSLGHGIGIAVGMALADRSKNVYCLLSDGEMAEGSVWEALQVIREQKINNLKLYLNDNGYGAYKMTRLGALPSFIEWRFTNMNDYPEWLQGQIAHYKVLDKKEYTELMRLLK